MKYIFKFSAHNFVKSKGIEKLMNFILDLTIGLIFVNQLTVNLESLPLETSTSLFLEA